MSEQREKHKVFRGADLEALKPWVAGFNQLAPGVNAVVCHAIKPEEPDPKIVMQGLVALLTGEPPPPRPNLGIVICPDTLRKAPLLLREMADLYEDLAKQTGIEIDPTKVPAAWTPKGGA